MNNLKLDKALKDLESELENDMKNLKHKSDEELKESIEDYSEMAERLNNASGNKNDKLIECINLLKNLEKIAETKNYKMLPDVETVDDYIEYLHEHNDFEMIASISYYLGDIYSEIAEQTKDEIFYRLSLMYYSYGIVALAEIIDKKSFLLYETYGILLSKASVLIDKLKVGVGFDFNLVKKGYIYARKYKSNKLAANIANNYILIYQDSGEIEKSHEINELVKSYKNKWFRK